MLEGEAVWKAGAEGRWSNKLLQSSLSRSDTPQGWSLEDGRPQDLATNGQLPKLVKNPAAYFIEYNDGLKATLLMLSGALEDFNFAARVQGSGVQSCQFLLTPIPNVTYSACLVSHIERLFETGKADYPVQRTLLVSGILESCLTSRLQEGKRLPTPHLAVKYRPSHLSTTPR